MGKHADLKIRRSTAINLTDESLRRWIADVLEPGFDGDFGSGVGEIAETKEVCVRGGIDPDRGFQFGGKAGSLGRAKARAAGFENTGKHRIEGPTLMCKGSA